MPDPSPLVIGDREGYTPHIGRLVCMLRYARRSLLQEVDGLTQAQLDHLHDPEANSIGALLHHIAAVEWYYQRTTFEVRPTEAQEAEWGPALELGDAGRQALRGRPPAFYTDLLAGVRQGTLEGLRAREDAWLEAPLRWGDTPVNRHWMWFHVFEDELNHRGQIRWLKRRLPGAAG